MALRFQPKLLKRIGLSTIAIAVATAVVGVAIALFVVQLSGTVSSNEFTPPTTSTSTTTTTLPSGSGLVAAFTATPGDCANAVPSGVSSFSASAFDLNSTANQFVFTPGVLCVSNTGVDDIVSLSITASAAASGEAGCSAAEGTVDPEGATCGSDGELDDVVQVILSAGPGTDGNCTVVGTVIVPLDTPTNLVVPGNGDPTGFFQPGRECTWFMSLGFVDGVTDDQKLAASTDTADLTFDITSN